MGNFNFVYLVGKKVSVLIDVFKPGHNVKENYVGKIKQSFDDFIVLRHEKLSNSQEEYPLKEIIIKKAHIVSIWVYEDQEKTA